MNKNSNPLIFIMGVSGSGKSTIGKLLAERLMLPFFDGDDFHPKENIAKMASGTPLNDTDRYGWLVRLNELAQKNSPSGVVIACSALKAKYRQLLEKDIEDTVVWVYLKGTFDDILERLRKRTEHFMPAALLESQFEALEIPQNAISVSIDNSPESIVSEIIRTLSKHK